MNLSCRMRAVPFGVLSFTLLMAGGPVSAADTATETAARLDALQQQVAEQTARLDALKRSVAKEEASLNQVKRALGAEVLSAQRARGDAPATADSTSAAVPGAAASTTAAAAPQPVGQAPASDQRAPAVAQALDLPGVLTPAGKTVLEPSFGYAYSSSNRVALVGYTVIPAILIGLIDVRETNRNTFSAALTGRYGVNNRFELEARLPYVYRSDTSVGREFLEGAASNAAFDSSGSGIGDVELTARYQLNDGGIDKPFYVGALRFKSRTGTDPFEVETTRNVMGLRDGLQTSLPTGSGFYGLQPALTVLYPSDPAVFFGTVSYLYSFARDNVMRNLDDGPPENLGTVQPGGVFGLNFGMGLGLNEKSSFSLGVDLATVGKTKQNGVAAADSVRVQLATLQLGYSYRLGPQQNLSLTVGAGLTRDTPDFGLTVRLPYTF